MNYKEYALSGRGIFREIDRRGFGRINLADLHPGLEALGNYINDCLADSRFGISFVGDFTRRPLWEMTSGVFGIYEARAVAGNESETLAFDIAHVEVHPGGYIFVAPPIFPPGLDEEIGEFFEILRGKVVTEAGGVADRREMERRKRRDFHEFGSDA